MPAFIQCSSAQVALLVAAFALAMIAGCGLSRNDSISETAKPTGIESNEMELADQVVGADSPGSGEPKLDGNSDNTDNPIVDLEPAVVRQGVIPKVKLSHSTKTSTEEANEIKQLIRTLEAIDSPDFGISGTMNGDAFLPIAGMSQPSVVLFTNHQLKSSPELRQLVALGPKSLPFLLDSLDDKTPTKLVLNHGGGFGAMWYANELWGNAMNPIEQRILASNPHKPAFNEEHIETYTVKIGDVCLVAIGQIVGRAYQAVRYQPSACIVINSPTHDAKLCQQVRDIWSSQDASQRLLDSLLLDYATEGVSNGKSLDGWSIGSGLQVAAAMRLLFYFPDESVELIANRLDKLEVAANGPGRGSMHSPEELEGYRKQCVANGVSTVDFVEAVAWCSEPRIKAAMLRVFKRATDPDVVVATLRTMGSDNPGLVRERLDRMIDALPSEEGGPFGDGYNFLVALGEYCGIEAKSTFQKYLEPGTVQRCRSTCHALRKVRGEWAAEVLAPLLADRRKANGWTYAVIPKQNEPRLPILICDEAAETIAAANKGMTFEMRGTRADLDRQINLIQMSLAER
jgi:hypothetical protein